MRTCNHCRVRAYPDATQDDGATLTMHCAYPQPAPTAPRWSISPDAYSLKVRLPDLEPHTVKAALAPDGTKIEIMGERKIEGCTCVPSIVREVPLPYRPRAEDIDVSVDKNSVLSLRLTRHAKVDAATPLTVTAIQDDKTPPGESEALRPIRFVPHASATESAAPTETTLDEQEKTLTDKFRSAALAAVAVNNRRDASGPTKDSVATAPEGAPTP